VSVDERSGWRDLGLSIRHRLWGHDCPIVDIDFLVVEYDEKKPIALVEYKHEHAKNPNFDDANYTTLKTLGDWAGLPVFNARYADDYSWFKLTPLNAMAEARLPPEHRMMTERQYVDFLYWLRGRLIPPEVQFDGERLRT